jgi:glycosyltransferase domain-containing protein
MRQLLFYADKPIHIIFADGSDEDWGQGVSGSIGEMTWEYFRISGSNSLITRLGASVERVKTQFMFFLDDEEIILWTGVEKAISFLQNNPEHSCAGGKVGYAHAVGRRKYFASKKLSVSDWGRFSRNFSLTHNDVSKRLIPLISSNRTGNIFYQLHRTEIIKKFSSQLAVLPIEGKYIGTTELLFTYFIITQGKWQMENYPYWFRYGGSVTVPSSNPSFIDQPDAKILAEIIINWSEKEFDQVSAGFSREEFRDKLLHLILKTYGISGKQFKIARLERSKFSRVSEVMGLTFTFRVLVKFKNLLKLYLFAVSPSVFEFAYPNERKRVSSYSKIHASNEPSVYNELARFNRLWSSYPDGMSKMQLKTELENL